MAQATIARACPLCGSAGNSREYAGESYDAAELNEYAFASRKLPEYMHFRLLLCGGCDLLYASPVPEKDALVQAYRAAAYDSGVEARFAAQTYARVLRRVLGRLPDRRGAVDIGAGDGAFLKELLSLGFTEVVGVEPSAAPIAAAEEAVRPLLRQAAFRAEDFPEQAFRLVTCFQTLEHVPEPLQFCRGAFRLLKAGGAMLCVVHNRRALSARLLGRRSPIYDIEHLQLFSRRSARQLLQSAGFRDVRTAWIFNRYPASYWLRLFPFPAALKRVLVSSANRLAVGRIPIALPAGNLAVYGFKS
jgi:SAM-dependent methyltransferase